MKVKKLQIASWIELYLNSESAHKVMNRSWTGRLIHGLQCDRKDASGENVSVRWIKFIQDNLSSFDKCTDFESIIRNVESCADKFYGIGDLTIYDTATMIGCPINVYPEVVYLHAGTADGAKALGILGKTATKEQFVEVCDAFGKLEPIQIEDFLCIYKKQLAGETDIAPHGCCC